MECALCVGLNAQRFIWLDMAAFMAGLEPISQFDAMIVAMARSRGASLATRNAKDFEGCGVDVINPWKD
jgi:predicted nucleic acid-binding protein